MSKNAKVTKIMLIQELATSLGVSKAQAEKFLSAFIDLITSNLQKGKEVTITGFGTFRTSVRRARQGVNPQTGAKIRIPESKSVSFKAGKTLKNSV
jgi:DNA-binding protein HU-beta